MTWIFRENSLDAIRLFAASQVAVLHTWEILLPGEPEPFALEILRYFPGVPIFFFVSGYLISKSYERSPTISEFGKNRVLRLYPALIICVFLNLVMVWSTGYFNLSHVPFLDIGLLFLAKTTILQFYNPDFMRAFGDGVLNGSLWTICVELQFYIITPILYIIFSGRNNKVINTKALILLILVFIAANRLLYILQADYSHQVLWKLYRVSFAPWIYMFLVGIFVQRNFEKISQVLSKVSSIQFTLLYILSAFLLTRYLGLSVGNAVSPFLFALLIPLVLRLAYSAPNKVNAIMRGNDISYGIYIWHMPIVNQMIYLNYNDHLYQILIVIILAVVIAIFSWLFIEKPSLSLKHYTLNTRLASYTKKLRATNKIK